MCANVHILIAGPLTETPDAYRQRCHDAWEAFKAGKTKEDLAEEKKKLLRYNSEYHKQLQRDDVQTGNRWKLMKRIASNIDSDVSAWSLSMFGFRIV